MSDRRDAASGPERAGGGDAVDDPWTGAFRAVCSECAYSVVVHPMDEDVDPTDSVFECQAEHQERYGPHHVLEFDRTRPFGADDDESVEGAADD